LTRWRVAREVTWKESRGGTGDFLAEEEREKLRGGGGALVDECMGLEIALRCAADVSEGGGADEWTQAALWLWVAMGPT
jgi:hypothetical protein